MDLQGFLLEISKKDSLLKLLKGSPTFDEINKRFFALINSLSKVCYSALDEDIYQYKSLVDIPYNVLVQTTSIIFRLKEYTDWERVEPKVKLQIYRECCILEVLVAGVLKQLSTKTYGNPITNMVIKVEQSVAAMTYLQNTIDDDFI